MGRLDGCGSVATAATAAPPASGSYPLDISPILYALDALAVFLTGFKSLTRIDTEKSAAAENNDLDPGSATSHQSLLSERQAGKKRENF